MTEDKAAATKVVTVRLPYADAERAEFVARVANISVNDVFRRALDEYFDCLRKDTDFTTRAKAQLARESEIASQFV